MKKLPIWVWILIGAVAMFVGLVIIGTVIEYNDTATTTTTTTTTTKPLPPQTHEDGQLLTQEQYQEYMEGCMVVPEDFGYCDCTVVYMEEHYGRDKIMEMAEEYSRTGVLPAGADRANEFCMAGELETQLN